MTTRTGTAGNDLLCCLLLGRLCPGGYQRRGMVAGGQRHLAYGASVTYLAGLITGVVLLSIVELVLVLWAASVVLRWIDES